MPAHPRVPAHQATFTRRHVLALSASAAVAAQLGLPGIASANRSRTSPGRIVYRRLTAPVERAHRYLDTVMDAYQQGATPRLLQSYNNSPG